MAEVEQIQARTQARAHQIAIDRPPVVRAREGTFLPGLASEELEVRQGSFYG